MTIVMRMTRLFKADVHELLDRLEEPEAVLKQAVRDMEDEVASRQAEIKRLDEEQRRISTRRQDLENKLLELDSELGVSLASGRDDLAKVVMRKKLETQRVEKALKAQIDTVTTTIGELKKELDDRKVRLESIRQKAEIFSEVTAAGDAGNRDSLSVTEAEVELALLKEREARRGKSKGREDKV